MLEEDRLSESFGSVISLRSVGSDGALSPKPPSGTRKSKANIKRSSKVKKQESPYVGSRSGTPKKTGRELWVASIRQGNGLSAESSAMGTLNGMNTSYSGQSKAKASTSAYLMDQLLMATGRTPKSHTRSASYTNIRIGGNGPAYKTAEEYYDEVIELKKRINQLMRENETIKSKMHKVEEDNFNKARQIEELINPNMQTNDMRRTLTDRKADSSAVITSLKHKLHSIERVLKSKDSELSKLKNDIKYSDVAELQMQNEVFYQEIQRLTALLTEPRSANTMLITSEIKKERTPEGKIQRYSEAVQSLSDDNNRLLVENASLKQDLKKAMELNLQTLNLSKDVEDMNRMELLAKISQLEQQIREEDNGGKEPETPRSKRSPSQFKRFPGKAGEEIKRLEDRENELLDELEKQKGVIDKLKEDRTHYRKLADEYRVQLEKLKSGGTVTPKQTAEESERPRSESVLSTTSSKKASKKKSIDSSDERKVKERKENNAAITIQRNWRKHRDFKTDAENENYDQAIASIQAALRGHTAREKLLRTRRIVALSDDDVDDMSDESSLYEEDVLLMQAAFRGHLARQQALTRKDQFSYEDSEDDLVDEAPRYRRSLDTGEPMTSMLDRSSLQNKRSSRPSMSSHRRNMFQSEEMTTRSSIERESLNRRRNERERQNHNGYNHIHDDDDDEDDDDDVVIGSTTSLTSNDRFEQSYLSQFKRHGSQNSQKSESRMSESRMSSIREEDRSHGRSSLNHLQKSSTSWGSVRKSNIADFLSESEDDIVASSQKGSSKNSASKKMSLSNSKPSNKTRESQLLADRWASSGDKNIKNKKKQERSLITARPTSSTWQRNSKSSNDYVDDDDDDDDDDLVISPAMSKQRRKELEDELM